MALRGQGSLQQLLGKPVVGKRPASKQGKEGRAQQAQHGSDSKAKRQKPCGQQHKSVRSYFTSLPRSSVKQPASSGAGAVANGSGNPGTLGPLQVAAAQAGPSSQDDAPAAWELHTKLVGRRHQAASSLQALPPAAQLLLLREPANPMDANAILVQIHTTADGCTNLGHLPASLSAHLGPLMDANLVAIQVTAPAAALAETAAAVPLHLALTLLPQPTTDTGTSSSHGDVASSMPEAVVAAAVQAAREAVRQQQSGAVLCNNFDIVLEHVRRHDAHCLCEEELQLLGSFQALDEEARCLFLRLLLRKGDWYQLQSITYADVPDAEQAGQRLAAARLAAVTSDSATDPLAALQSLPCHVLHSILALLVPGKGRSRAVVSSAPKADVIAAIAGNSCIERLRECLNEAAGPCLRILPAVAATFKRMQRLFFLNEGQDLSGFLATERGGVRYPRYSIQCCHKPFPDRAALLAYEEALQQAAALEEALQDEDMDAAEASLRPALDAIEAGKHKHVCWNTQHAPLPNSCSCSGQRTNSDASTLTSPSIGAPGASGVDGRQPDCDMELSHSSLSGSPSTHNTSSCSGSTSSGGCASGEPAAGGQQGSSGSSSCSSQPLFLARFHASWVHAGMATVGVSLLEKRREYQAAVALLQRLLGGNCCPSRRGLWWLRLSINLEHLGQLQDALETAETALADGWVRHGERLALQRRVLRLGKPPRRWRRPSWAAAAEAEPREVVITGRPLGATVGSKSRFYGADDEQCSVEELALQHYETAAGGGWQGMHTEGGVWMILFGLLMWDILFAAVPDVFRSPFQTAPLDLDTDAFYPARRAIIDARLQEIAVGGAGEFIKRHWDAHCGVMCRGINWARFTCNELLEIAECVGGLGLSVVCRLLAEDHNSLTGGMPDLLLWKPAERVCKLSEVKGPRDRLSDQQRAWLQALASAELEVEVCKVLEPQQLASRAGRK